MAKCCPQTTCCNSPQLQWRGQCLAHVWIECGSCGFVLCDDGQLADWLDPEEIAWAKERAAEEAYDLTPDAEEGPNVLLTPTARRPD